MEGPTIQQYKKIERNHQLRTDFVSGHGEERLMICAIEEMSELTKVFTKFLRHDAKFSMASLEEELAHVLMMVEACQQKMEISDMAINNLQLNALKRATEAAELESYTYRETWRK